MSAPPLVRAQSIATVLGVLAVSFGALLATTPHAAATTYVRGWITTDTTWGSSDTVYVLYQHVTVRPGVTLTVLPGTTVRFDPNRALFIEGTLVADGLQGSEIQFRQNNTAAVFPPWGIQFNASSTGSVTWSVFERFSGAIVALDSSPTIASNLVLFAINAFTFVRSSSWVTGNAIVRATTGILLSESNAQVDGNYVNNTNTGIHATNGGAPGISNNVITNASAGTAVGIHVTAGASAQLWNNWILNVMGVRGLNGFGAGAAGGAGGVAIGILIDTSGSAYATGNVLDTIVGGAGGNGVDNPAGTGGSGGEGGAAAGIVVAGTSIVDMWGNSISNLYGGRGGNGGGSATTAVGGKGGDGGDAAGIEALGTAAPAAWRGNGIGSVVGGVGGNGGDALQDGTGGTGGDAFGFFAVAVMDADASGNTVQGIWGGPGGNSTIAGNGNGGSGGAASGIGISSVAGTATIHSNTIATISGGNGGRGGVGGAGGNATAAYAAGNNGGAFNASSATGNWAQDVTGGDGALGAKIGGAGGTAAGITMALVTPFTGSNTAWNLRGGRGGDAGDGNDGGRGGDAAGFIAYLVRNGWSSSDVVVTATKGAQGSGPPPLASYGMGFYTEGDGSFASAYTIENGTLAGVGDHEIHVGDFAAATTINTPFNGAKLSVGTTRSTLTVKNFLATDVHWPDGITNVAGASILVTEDGSPVWDFVSPTGYDEWLLTTDRVYVDSLTPNDVRNDVTVSFLSYSFVSDPRTVDMATSHTETFVMIDSDAPVATAGPLPTYTASWTLTIAYTASDGNGTGLGDATLWYQWSGGGGWTSYATQPASNPGQFAFTATADGTYEFAVTADDLAGNGEPNPNANETWTIVDTTRPASRVAPQPAWRNTLTFTVSWDPDPGVTDIATYTIQYNRGFGWTNWLVKVSITSASFTASSQGLYEFRAIAEDFAGNLETVAGNDTWTIVDTWAPEAGMVPLAAWQTSLGFLVQWQTGAPDVATFHVQYRDNGGAWTDWFAATTLRSSTFTGVDGHTYEFRCTATDFAGNADPLPPNNQTWTAVDVTAPQSAVSALPTFSASLTINLAWGPVNGTTDANRFTVQVSDNGGAWTNLVGYVDTPAQSATFTGLDGHTYAFRSIAKDYAGNVETVSGADASTTVDVSAPSTTSALAGTPGLAGWYVSAVTVTLTATDATSGVASIAYRVDAGSWQAYGAPITVTPDGAHLVEFQATDVAGNIETIKTASFNIDVTAPSTAASLSGTVGDNGVFRTSVGITLAASDAASGVASVAYRIDGASWQTYTTPFYVTTDGAHTVDFRATDAAGLAEVPQNVSFSMDTRPPGVVASSPRGTGTNTTPLIVITFTEPMNRASVEAAFTINPDMNGAFVWNANSTQVTFYPARELEAGTTYFVALDSSAKDLAGNPLPGTSTFSFTTAAASPPGGGPAAFDFLWIVAVIAAALGGTLFIAMRRMAARSKPAAPAPAEKKSEAMIDDVFLLYHDGILIKHETRRLKPDIDTDILSGMLTAVQSFVKDSFRSEEGELDELTFGAMHILIGRGKWLILAAMVQGDGTAFMRTQIEKAIAEMESKQTEQIEKWDGNMSLAKVLAPYVKTLIRGEYA